MRLFLLILFLAFFLATAYALKEPQKAVLVTFSPETPDSEVDKAIDALESVGGVITHNFELLKGFAAKASENALESMKALSESFVPFIEEDGIVSIDGSLSDSRK